MKNFFKLVFCIILCEFAGIIGSIFTVPSIPTWYAALTKPAINPPNWVFSPVWITLFALVGISLFLVWKNDWRVKNHIFERKKKAWNRYSQRLWTGDWQKQNAIGIFAVQLFLNILWSIVFFSLHSSGFAFFDLIALWIAIIYTIINFYRVSKASAYILLSYIAWVTFAGYLNLSIWLLN